MLPGVNRHDLGDLARVPQLDHPVRVRGRHDAAQQVERSGVAAVVVPVEGLRAQPAARVPDRDRLVGRGGAEVGGVGLPAHVVDRVHVAAQRGAALGGVHVPQAHLGCVWGGGQGSQGGLRQMGGHMD